MGGIYIYSLYKIHEPFLIVLNSDMPLTTRGLREVRDPEGMAKRIVAVNPFTCGT